MGGTPERLKDAQGHEWPITGYWCDACGMPLHGSLRDVGVHPTCEVQPARPVVAPSVQKLRLKTPEGGAPQ